MAESISTRARRAPLSERPGMDPAYGIHPGDDGLLPWQWAEERLTASRNYWVCTTRPDGRPHAMPVWGVWSDGALFFSTSRSSVKGRNLAANPAISIHLESGDECVVLEGEVMAATGSALLRADDAYAAKYINAETGEGFKMSDGASGDAPPNGAYMLRPRRAFGWQEKDYPHSATRWRFGA
jgi:hypothetical protein